MANKGFRKESYGIERQLIADAMYLSSKAGKMNAVVEIDITALRKKMTDYKRASGNQLSISTVFLYCYAQALSVHKRAMALRSFTNTLYIFEDADIFFPYETVGDIAPAHLRKHVFKSANKLSIADIEKQFQSLPQKGNVLRWHERLFMHLPSFIRRLLYWTVMQFPVYRKNFFGNVFFSTVSGTNFTNYNITCFSPHFHAIGMLVSSALIMKEGDQKRIKVNIHLSADHAIINGIDFYKFTDSFLKQVEAFTI
jgi:hypothetical protein